MTMKPVVVLPKFFLSRIEFTNYRLLQGMWLSIETSGSEFVVSEPDLSLYGVGATIGEAIDEFVGMLIDLYDELSDSENVLSCSLRRQLEYLRSVITNQ